MLFQKQLLENLIVGEKIKIKTEEEQGIQLCVDGYMNFLIERKCEIAPNCSVLYFLNRDPMLLFQDKSENFEEFLERVVGISKDVNSYVMLTSFRVRMNGRLTSRIDIAGQNKQIRSFYYENYNLKEIFE